MSKLLSKDVRELGSQVPDFLHVRGKKVVTTTFSIMLQLTWIQSLSKQLLQRISLYWHTFKKFATISFGYIVFVDTF